MIPKNLRMMYVHAYQSYLWNSVTSERIKLYGCDKPIVGDLVLADKDSVLPEEGDEDDSPAASLPARGKVTQDSLRAVSKVAKVKVLEEADLDGYTIHDVVLPLPGFSVVYPGGELGRMYREMMRADGLDADSMYRPQR